MQFCEWCGTSGRCCVCGLDQDVARWEDDGGRAVYVDHDAETKPADTVPEMAALTNWDLRSVGPPRGQQLALVVACVVWVAWCVTIVWYFGFRR